MQNRGKVMNKLALVLLSIVVLELILIGDQVQPMKSLKKKIYLKKLKKILPLLALIKPKKKLILVPIPIPMFNKHAGHYYPYPSNQHHHHHKHQTSGGGVGGGVKVAGPQAMTADGTTPMSFIMEPMSLVGALGPQPGSMQLMPMSMQMPPAMLEPSAVGTQTTGAAPQATQVTPQVMMMPSMTMTISSDGGGGTMSEIELSSSSTSSSGGQPTAMMMMSSDSANTSNNSSTSQLGALTAAGTPQIGRPPTGSKWLQEHQEQQQQQLQQVHLDNLDLPEQLSFGTGSGGSGGGTGGDPNGGEYYYSSPWVPARQPLASPAKLLRNERLRQGAATRPRNNEPAGAAAGAVPPNQRPRPQAGRYQSQAEPGGGGHAGGQYSTPAKMINPEAGAARHQSGRLKQPPARPQQQQQQQQQQFAAPMPVLVIRNQWRPSKVLAPSGQQQSQQPAPPPEQLQSGKNQRQLQQERVQQQQEPIAQRHLSQQQEQQIQQALDYEQLIPIGPPQLMPIYQTPNGRLHMTPPTPTTATSRVAPPTPSPPPPPSELITQPSRDLSSSFESDHEREGSGQPVGGQHNANSFNSDAANSEVQTIGGSSSSSTGPGTRDSASGQLFQPTAANSIGQHRPDDGDHQEGGNSQNDHHQSTSTTVVATPAATTTAPPALAKYTGQRFSMKDSGKQQAFEVKRKPGQQLDAGGY